MSKRKAQVTMAFVSHNATVKTVGIESTRPTIYVEDAADMMDAKIEFESRAAMAQFADSIYAVLQDCDVTRPVTQGEALVDITDAELLANGIDVNEAVEHVELVYADAGITRDEFSVEFPGRDYDKFMTKHSDE